MLESSRPLGGSNRASGIQPSMSNDRRSFANVSQRFKVGGPKERALLYINLSQCTLEGKPVRPRSTFYMTIAMDSQKFKSKNSKVRQQPGNSSTLQEKCILDLENDCFVVEINKYFASSPLRLTLWKRKMFGADIPLGMAVIQLGDIRRRQIARLKNERDESYGENIRTMATTGFAHSTANSTEGHCSLEEKDRNVTEDAKDTKSLDRNVLTEVQLEINKSYGTAQKFQLGLYKDTVSSSALSLEKFGWNKRKRFPITFMPSELMYKRRKHGQEDAQLRVGQVNVAFWYISEVDCATIKNLGSDRSDKSKHLLYSPLHYAATLAGGDLLIEHMIKFLRAPVSLRSIRRGNYNLSPFDVAALSGNQKIVEVLGRTMTANDYLIAPLEGTGKDGSLSKKGGTSLHFYCKYGNDTKILQSMIEAHPAMGDALDEHGHTPFLLACAVGNANFAQILASQGIRIARKPVVAKNGDTALMLACKGGHESVVNWLLSREADPNLKNFGDESALMCAAGCSKGDQVAASLIKTLCSSGAELRTQTKVNTVSTAFHRAAQSGHVKTFKALVEQCNCRPENTQCNGATKKELTSAASTKKFLALVGNDGKPIYDLFWSNYVRSNIYQGKDADEVKEITAWYDDIKELNLHSHPISLWNGFSENGECTVDLCGPFGALILREKEITRVAPEPKKLSGHARSEDFATDQEYVFLDEVDTKEFGDSTLQTPTAQKHDPSSAAMLLKQISSKEMEEKIDVEETKSDDANSENKVTILRSNTTKANFTSTTRAEALNIRKNAIIGISNIVLGLRRDINTNDTPTPPKTFCGMVAHKLHSSGWNLDKVVMDLTSQKCACDESANSSTRKDEGTGPRLLVSSNVLDIPSGCKQVIERTPKTCSVCLEDKSVFYGLDCRHMFCSDCWRDHMGVSAKMDGDRVITHCKCPQYPDCNYFPDESAWKVLADPHDFERYQNHLLSAYVKFNSDRVTFCGNPRCERVLHASKPFCGNEENEVRCSVCGYEFCFNCKDVVHAPATCQQWESWKMKKNDEEALLAEWLMKNTKLCPKPGCKHRLEKNEGCKHMTCKCGHEFCWDCLRPWSMHDETTGGFFRCAYFDPSKDYEKFDFAAVTNAQQEFSEASDSQGDSQANNSPSKVSIKRQNSAEALANFTFNLKRYAAFEMDYNRASSLYQLFALIRHESLMKASAGRNVLKGNGRRMGIPKTPNRSKRHLYQNFKNLPSDSQDVLMLAITQVKKIYRTMKNMHVVLEALTSNGEISLLETQLVLFRMENRVSTVAKLMKAVEAVVYGNETLDQRHIDFLVAKVRSDDEAFHQELHDEKNLSTSIRS